MGTITVNVKDEVEEEFRRTVKVEKGEGKGKLGEAIMEAFQRWIEEKQQQQLANKLKAWTEKGFPMGKITIKSRDELYDR
ncbi:hypothetical protein HYS48_03535, partial [Candidatus Woesearchaeota archaeon]|nr:hypothetical protein [Candidatus Woesearchaeota archaeon]